MVLADFSAERLRRGCVSDGKNFCGTCMGHPFSVTVAKEECFNEAFDRLMGASAQGDTPAGEGP